MNTRKSVKPQTNSEFRQAFVLRLKLACDQSKNVPPPNKGRQQYIADQLKLAPEAISKWFKGVSMPRPNMMAQLAELLGVEQTWLQFGVNPEMDRQDRKTFSREMTGAVHLVMGLTMLNGGYCGLPSAKDDRSETVDFYATVEGAVHMVHVCLARVIDDEQCEVLITPEYKQVDCVVVIPRQAGKYDLVLLNDEAIDENKGRRNGLYSLIITRVGASKYLAGEHQLPKIRFVGDRPT